MSKFASIAAAALCAVACTVAQADVVRYVADLSGPAESPPNASPGTGFVTVDYDSDAHTLKINAWWTGLLFPTTVAHIHCCTSVAETGAIGVAVTPGTLPGFPAGVFAGTYTSPLLDLALASTFTAGFVTTFAGGVLADAEEALIAGFDAGKAYFNIHASLPGPPVTGFPGGEIRGFLQVPEPTSLALMALSLAALGATSRRKSS